MNTDAPQLGFHLNQATPAGTGAAECTFVSGSVPGGPSNTFSLSSSASKEGGPPGFEFGGAPEPQLSNNYFSFGSAGHSQFTFTGGDDLQGSNSNSNVETKSPVYQAPQPILEPSVSMETSDMDTPVYQAPQPILEPSVSMETPDMDTPVGGAISKEMQMMAWLIENELECLPRLYPVCYSSFKRPRRVHVLPQRFWGTIYFCVEYKEGVYIDKNGVPRPDEEVGIPEPKKRKLLAAEEYNKASKIARAEHQSLLFDVSQRLQNPEDADYEKAGSGESSSSESEEDISEAEEYVSENDIMSDADSGYDEFVDSEKEEDGEYLADPIENFLDDPDFNDAYSTDGKDSTEQSTSDEEDQNATANHQIQGSLQGSVNGLNIG